MHSPQIAPPYECHTCLATIFGHHQKAFFWQKKIHVVVSGRQTADRLGAEVHGCHWEAQVEGNCRKATIAHRRRMSFSVETFEGR